MIAVAYTTPSPDAPADPNPAFFANVFHDPEAGVWIAICDDIPVATEADTPETLIDRVWQIAPEIAVDNGLRASKAEVRLTFVISTRPAATDDSHPGAS